MEPKKDYQDYSAYINSTFQTEKESLISKTVEAESKRASMPPASN